MTQKVLVCPRRSSVSRRSDFPDRKPRAILALASAAVDVAAKRSYLIDQGEGEDPVRKGMRRRGYATDLGWLPG